MSISGIAITGSSQGNYPNNGAQSIDQEIQQLQKQVESIKSNKKLSSEEKDKRIKNLQDQIKRLEEEKTKLERRTKADATAEATKKQQNGRSVQNLDTDDLG